MRFSILAAVFTAIAVGNTSVVVAGPAPAPEVDLPPAPCGTTGDLCTNIGILGCCTGFFCNGVLAINDVGVSSFEFAFV